MKFMTILMMIGDEEPDDTKNLLATGCKIYNYIWSNISYISHRAKKIRETVADYSQKFHFICRKKIQLIISSKIWFSDDT